MHKQFTKVHVLMLCLQKYKYISIIELKLDSGLCELKIELLYSQVQICSN